MFHLDLTMQFYEHVHLKKNEKKRKEIQFILHLMYNTLTNTVKDI